MTRLDTLSEYIQDAIESWHCPGAAVAIVREDEVLHHSVHGLRDLEGGLAMEEDTRFPMASVTKSFTAMSIALLVDEGKLEWDKPVREYMPEFILADPYVTEHVTVRDMLSHRTGLPRHDLSAWRLDISRADYIKRMRHYKFSATFREKFQYNNLMYYAAAYLVDKIAEQRWEDLVHQRIFMPLNMVASSFAPDPPLAGQANAKGYRIDRDQDGGFKGLIPTRLGRHTALSPGAAGSLFSTLADLIQWLKVHVNDGRAGDVQLVSRDNLKQMHLPQTIVPGGGLNEALLGNTIFAYGMGWFIEPYRELTLVHHGGHVEGHSLIIGFIPQEKIGVIVLTNIAQMPVPQILLYEGIDRALGLSDRDWNTGFHRMVDPFIIAEAKGKQTAIEERLPDAPPTHPLEAYGGTYEAKGYPDFAVRVAGASLQACTVGSLDWSELRHYHYNVFEWHWADFDVHVKIRFLVNDNGQIDSISIPIEPAVENVIFVRKQPELSSELVAALVGEFDPPVEGITFTITAHKGRIYFAQTGEPPQEIKPYKLDDSVVGFRLKRDRLDFVRKHDLITHLVVKTPFMTLEAPHLETSTNRGAVSSVVSEGSEPSEGAGE